MTAVTPVSRSKGEPVDAIEAGVVGGDDTVAGLQPAQHFDRFGGATAKLDRSAYGAGPVAIEHEHPGTA